MDGDRHIGLCFRTVVTTPYNRIGGGLVSMNKKYEAIGEKDDELFARFLILETQTRPSEALEKSKRMRERGEPRVISYGSDEDWQQYVYGGKQR